MDEAILTYNNSIHTSTKLTPFEAITGHLNTPSPFPTEPNLQTNQEYLDNHKKEYEKLAKLIQERSLKIKQNVITKLNTDRRDPPNHEENEIIYESENRRNKLAPKIMKHKVLQNNKISVITNKKKVHKQNIKNKRKFSDSSPTHNNNA